MEKKTVQVKLARLEKLGIDAYTDMDPDKAMFTKVELNKLWPVQGDDNKLGWITEGNVHILNVDMRSILSQEAHYLSHFIETRLTHYHNFGFALAGDEEQKLAQLETWIAQHKLVTEILVASA